MAKCLKTVKFMRLRWAGHVARTGRQMLHIGIFRESFWKRQTGLTKMDLREEVCEDVKWMKLGQVRGRWLGLALSVLNVWALLPGS